MKKLIALAAALMLTAAAWAGATELLIEADAATHNGGAAGDPAGFIDGSGNLDVSGMAAGSTLKFNIILNDPDFTMGGYQFEIHYPSVLTALSENDADWDGNTGFIYMPGAYITGNFQMLPANNLGERTAGTVDNPAGKVTVGLIWTVPGDRPGPDAGGVIGQLCIEWNPSAVATCTSATESIRVVAGTEIFADDSASAAYSLASTIGVNFGDPSARVRADFNGDGNRTAGDALGAARCCLFGSGNAACNGGAIDWDSVPVAEFTQTFDFNCSGSVTAADALGAARLALGLVNRNAGKKLDYLAVSEGGEISFEYAKNQGAMVSATVVTSGMNIKDVYLDESAKKAGWALIHSVEAGALSYILMNPGTATDISFPAVKMAYDLTGKEGRIGVVQTLNQKTDYSEFAAAPKVYLLGDAQGSRK